MSTRSRVRLPALLLLSPAPLLAKSWIELLNLPQAGTAQIAGMGIALLAAIIFFIALEVRRQYREKLARQDRISTLIDEGIARTGLTELEGERLRAMATSADASDPAAIFDSISIFEKCVDREVDRLVSQGIIGPQRDEEEALITGIRKKLDFHHLDLEHPLASTRNMTIGQHVLVFGKNTRVPLFDKSIVSSNNEFIFTVKHAGQERLQIPAGTPLRIAFARQNDGVYGIESTVVASRPGFVDLRHTLELKRNQMRRDFRIEVNISLKFRLLQRAKPLPAGEKIDTRQREAKITDISGGGMSFLTDQEQDTLQPNDLLSLIFQVPGVPLSGVQGKVVRTSVQKGKGATFNKHHVQFTNIASSQKDKIVKYVFERLRQINQWR